MTDPLDAKIAAALLTPTVEEAKPRFDEVNPPLREAPQHGNDLIWTTPRLVVDNTVATGKMPPLAIAALLRDMAKQIEDDKWNATGLLLAVRIEDGDNDVCPFTLVGLTRIEALGLVSLIKLHL